MHNRIIPSRGKIVVQPFEMESQAGGSIILISKVGKMSSVARVIEVSDQKAVQYSDLDEPVEIDGPLYPVGTIVVVGRYSGTECQIGRRRCYIIAESEVLGRLVDGEMQWDVTLKDEESKIDPANFEKLDIENEMSRQTEQVIESVERRHHVRKSF